ncbi:MAG: TetR/AcrR family transcriptional regulator [Polyangiales bacterium]
MSRDAPLPASDDVRRRVLDASIALVAEQGVRAVSFREVARRAGVSHQAPYHHFGNHFGILREIAREGFASLAKTVGKAAEKEDDPLDALTAAGVAYVQFARKHVGHFRVMFQSTLVEGPRELEEAEETYDTLVRLATAVHDAGHGRGLSVDAICHLSWSTAHGLATLLVEGPMETRKTKGDVVREVVHGLGVLLGDERKKKKNEKKH